MLQRQSLYLEIRYESSRAVFEKSKENEIQQKGGNVGSNQDLALNFSTRAGEAAKGTNYPRKSFWP